MRFLSVIYFCSQVVEVLKDIIDFSTINHLKKWKKQQEIIDSIIISLICFGFLLMGSLIYDK